MENLQKLFKFKYFYGKIFSMIDNKDRRILSLIIQDSSLSNREISEKLQIPITTVHNRIKKMERKEIIKKYTAQLDEKKLGYPIPAYIFITVDYALPNGEKLDQEGLAKKLRSLDEVTDCAILTGETDIIIRVRTEDVPSLNDFVINKLRKFDGIGDTKTAIILNEINGP